MHRHRGFLFLQGLASPLFTRLGDRLRGQEHQVFRVNFCAGDSAFWQNRPAWNYRGGLEELSWFLESRFCAHRITDLILFGDCRPIHQVAIDLARVHGARVHVFEEGYIRPNWITLERGGTNARSRLPRDPLWYREVNRSLPHHGEGHPVRVPLKLRAGQDMAYRAWNLLNPVTFPGYRTHRPFIAPVEYAGWARRFAAMPLAERADSRLIHRILARKGRYFLLPLQLNGDSQIVQRSTFRDMGEVIVRVIGSFAAHAPKDAEIIVKNHPLDTGLYGYGRQIACLRKALELHERVHYIESGHLPTLLEHAAGTVVVNSSVGMSALHHGCPTKVLASPIYDMPGLTFSGSLEKFWNEPRPPDRDLFLAFRNTVIHATQVNGDFFTREGVDLAVAGCDRMLGPLSPLQGLFARHGEPEGDEYAGAAPTGDPAFTLGDLDRPRPVCPANIRAVAERQSGSCPRPLRG